MTFGMGKENYPALAMTQYNAIQFCKWLYARTGVFYRLPTEAEWEYASRAGPTSTYFFGENVQQIDEYAWYKANSNGKSNEVGKKKPNPWGLHDIYGNVAEWTDSSYDAAAYEYVSTMNPNIQDSKNKRKVVRGGSWKDVAYMLQVSTRDYEYADSARSYIGFRTVQDYMGTQKISTKKVNKDQNSKKRK